jgi:type VI secretion system secreted protein Hcp
MAKVDMFLKIEGASSGPIKGEASDANHRDEIEVLAWSWGMEGNNIHGQARARMNMHELKITKLVDSATTALMSSLRNNEVLKKTVLTVRKAGGQDPVEYFRITVEKGRVTSLVAQSGEDDDPARLTEHLSIAFSKVEVEYVPQGADGVRRGAMSFLADIVEGS